MNKQVLQMKHLRCAALSIWVALLGACSTDTGLDTDVDKKPKASKSDTVVSETQDSGKPDADDVIEVVDFAGNTISLTAPAKRIVALAPHLVENAYSAGAGDLLVGVVEFSDFPEAAKSLPIVGGYEKTNHERILELKPDLVLAWQSGNSHQSLELLRELGLTIYIDQADSLDDIAKTVRDIGTLSGTSAQAELAAKTYLEQLQRLKDQNKNKQKVSSFYQVWHSPLQTISGNHIISDAIETCGGVNIFADEFAVAPVVNIESILERDPESIIASGMSESRPDWLEKWLAWPSLKAVQKNNLFFVNPDHIQRHTFRIILGIQSVCQQLDQAREKS